MFFSFGNIVALTVKKKPPSFITNNHLVIYARLLVCFSFRICAPVKQMTVVLFPNCVKVLCSEQIKIYRSAKGLTLKNIFLKIVNQHTALRNEPWRSCINTIDFCPWLTTSLTFSKEKKTTLACARIEVQVLASDSSKWQFHVRSSMKVHLRYLQYSRSRM